MRSILLFLLSLFLLSCSTNELAIKNNHAFKQRYYSNHPNPFPKF